MFRKFKAFTLVEMLLATAIMGIVLLSVYSSFTMAMRTWKRVENDNAANAAKVLIPLTRQLRSAYLSADHDSDFVFQGSLSSVSFTAAAVINDDMYNQNTTDLEKVSYSIRTDQDSGQKTLVCEEYDILGKRKDNLKQIKLSKTIQTLSFAFYDGKQWQKGWDSSKSLPHAVKIRAEFQQGVYKDSFETIARVHCAADEVVGDL